MEVLGIETMNSCLVDIHADHLNNDVQNPPDMMTPFAQLKLSSSQSRRGILTA